MHGKYGYERAADMLLARMGGAAVSLRNVPHRIRTTSPLTPLALRDLKDAVIGLVSSGGLVPRG